MKPSDEQEVKTPDEARGAVKTGVWKILAISIVLAVIALIVIGKIS